MRYPKVRTLGHRDTDGILSMGTVTVLEKVDGANFRFRYDHESGRILFGSRRQLFMEGDKPVPIERVNKAFRHVVDYTTHRVDLDTLATLDEDEGGLWFFGEALHKHSIDYDAWSGKHPDPDGDVPNFLGFDVYSEGRDAFLPHDDVEALYNQLGLETVPVVELADTTTLTATDIDIPESEFRTPDPDADEDFHHRGLAEGVVIKNDDLGLRAKVTHEAFAETNWSASDPEEISEIRSEAGRFVNQFVTDARVQKQAHKLVDEGLYDELEMSVMADLPRRVGTDVLAEHGWEILTDDEMELTAEVKAEIRSQLSRRCSRVLQQMLTAQNG